MTVKGKESGIHAYLGVPFAKPPVGNSLRLAAPQPVERWEGVRDATKQPPMYVWAAVFESHILGFFALYSLIEMSVFQVHSK